MKQFIQLFLCLSLFFSCAVTAPLIFTEINELYEDNAVVELNIPKAEGNTEQSQAINKVIENHIANMLVFLEATRTYHKLMKNKPVNKKLVDKFETQLKAKGINPQMRAKQKDVAIMGSGIVASDLKISQYFITNFLRQNIIFNKKLLILPNCLVDVFTRSLLFIEYVLQKYLFRDKHNLHSFFSKNIKKSRLKKEETNPKTTTQKSRSLRSVVSRKRNFPEAIKRTDPVLLTSGPE